MKHIYYVIRALAIASFAFSITLPSSAADAPARADTSRTDSSRDMNRTATPARTISIQQATQRMIRQLQPAQAMRFMQQQAASNPQYKAQDPAPPKYEVADCTGSNGIPTACCSYTPGSGGSNCDMFILLCDHMTGTTSSGGGNAATCSGEGVLE